MEQIPTYVSITMILITILTLYFLYRATHSKLILIISIFWLLIQTIIGFSGFYTNTDTMPPRFALLIAPGLLTILLLLLLPRGKKLIDDFDQRWLTWLHIVRVPVEIVLLWLFLHKTVPQIMTFEGRNFDIISGITAPFIAYFGYHKHRLNKGILLTWNFICLGLLLNIIVIAILAAPTGFQQLAFDQPNKAVLYFPFIWLPCFIVPVVMLAHVTTIRQVLNSKF